MPAWRLICVIYILPDFQRVGRHLSVQGRQHAGMKEMEHIQPSKALDLITPVPDGYEMKVEGVTILAPGFDR